jgi:hypothetical protein
VDQKAALEVLLFEIAVSEVAVAVAAVQACESKAHLIRKKHRN